MSSWRGVCVFGEGKREQGAMCVLAREEMGGI